MPLNDGSEQVERDQSNVFEIGQLQREIKMAKAQAGDGYRQSTDANTLLRECRSLLEITALESPLRRDILDLICKIDEFCPQA